MENQLFLWSGWDGDHEYMTFAEPVLLVQVGKHPVGTRFDVATIFMCEGKVRFENYGPESSDGSRHWREIVYTAEYGLKLSIGDIIKE